MAKERVWKIGDTCYLNSGSVRMTIVAVTTTEVSVKWTSFDTAEMFAADLPIDAVKPNWK